MNHRKAMPANGTRLSASATALELLCSQAPGSWGSAGAEMRNSQKTVSNRMENSIPAIAAAFGVLKLVRVRGPVDIMGLIWQDRGRLVFLGDEFFSLQRRLVVIFVLA